MNSQPTNKQMEPVIERWHHAMRRLARIRSWSTWIARIAMASSCVVVFLILFQSFLWLNALIVLLGVVSHTRWQATSVDSQIKMLEGLRAKHGLRDEQVSSS
jgi:hypothetical protein